MLLVFILTSSSFVMMGTVGFARQLSILLTPPPPSVTEVWEFSLQVVCFSWMSSLLGASEVGYVPHQRQTCYKTGHPLMSRDGKNDRCYDSKRLGPNALLSVHKAIDFTN